MKVKGIVCRALGGKEFNCSRKSDIVCAIRVGIVGLNAITCLFIIYGVALK